MYAGIADIDMVRMISIVIYINKATYNTEKVTEFSIGGLIGGKDLQLIDKYIYMTSKIYVVKKKCREREEQQKHNQV